MRACITLLFTLIVVTASRGYAEAITSYDRNASACFRLDADSADGSLLSDLKPGTATIKAPGRLELTLDPSQECLQFLTDNSQAAEAGKSADEAILVVRVRFSSSFSETSLEDETKTYGFDQAAIRRKQSVTIASKRLNSEGAVYLHVEADVVPKSQAQGALEGSPGAAPISFRYSTKTTTISVLDTDFLRTLGYRASVPILARWSIGNHAEKYAVGVSTSLLWYPLRLTRRVTSPVLRKLAAEVALGTGKGVIRKVEDRTFFFVAAGLTYDGVIGFGYARDLSKSENFGFYANITLFSEKGLFGLVPVK
jgi:hypothetical protein